MDNTFPFVRGEFLTKASKFVYIQETIEWINRINNELDMLDPKTQAALYNRLMRQRQRLEEKVVNLKKSIVEDISASKE